MKKINITISPMGNPTVEAVGFIGTSCDAATKPIEDALSGGKGGDTSYKPEHSMSEASAEATQTW